MENNNTFNTATTPNWDIYNLVMQLHHMAQYQDACRHGDAGDVTCFSGAKKAMLFVEENESFLDDFAAQVWNSIQTYKKCSEKQAKVISINLAKAGIDY